MFDTLVTENGEMGRCLQTARQVAGSDLAVLITGESGTGKNLLAQAIHNAGPRAAKPCLVVNCSALSESLLESELFGHEQGAFTGADSTRKGCFELADGGTLILDEIGDMSLSAQAKILHAVEYKQFRRVGGQETLHSDARIIAMTNQPLEGLVVKERFREDLLYRLREVHLNIPPLRSRPEDVPVLAEVFMAEMSGKLGKTITGFSVVALDCLRNYAWPGNGRELRAVVRRAVLATRGPTVELEDLGLCVQPRANDSAPEPGDLSLRSAEKLHIVRVLQLTEGNKRRACDALRISRPTLDRKLEAYGIDAERFRPSPD